MKVFLAVARMTTLSELADHPAVVVTAYLFVFVSWTALASLDFISLQWKTVRNCRHDAQYHLFFAVGPTFTIAFYIIVQISARDFKEMSAALVALIFSLPHVARTVWAIAHLAFFLAWAANAIVALREHGIKFQLTSTNKSSSEMDGMDHGDPWDIADRLLVNDEVVDNQLLHGTPRCYLQLGDLDLRIQLNENLHGPQRISRHFAARLFGVVRIVLESCRILVNYIMYSIGIGQYPKNLKQVSHDPVALWLTWATVFVAQGPSHWIEEFEVATTTVDEAPEHPLKQGNSKMEQKFSKRRDYFAGEVLASATFHTMPRSSKENNMSFPNPFMLLYGSQCLDTANGRLTKTDLLMHAVYDGRALPFGVKHDVSGYSAYGIKLQRVTESMPDHFGQAVLNFDVERLEWLSILLFIGSLSHADVGETAQDTRSERDEKSKHDPNKCN